MTTFTFERAWTAGADSDLGSGQWLTAISGDITHYTVWNNTSAHLTLIGTAASGFEGWKVEFTPVTTFHESTRFLNTGAVQTVQLYDPSGALVSTASDFPTGAEFINVASSYGLARYGAEMTGSAGDDMLVGYRDGENVLHGGAGNDQLVGGSAGNFIEAGMGADTINGAGGFDVISLSEAPDQFQTIYLNQAPAGAGAFRIDNAEAVLTGEGGSLVHGSAAENELVIGGAGRDEMWGAAGVDLLVGRDGDDQLYGESGDDALDGGAGGDLLDGGEGFDTVDYSLAPGALTIDLRLAGGQQTGFGIDTLTSIEGLYGTEWGDTLTGGAEDNTLEGAGGADLLDGGEGNDNVIGGDGDDRLLGGAGADTVTDESGHNYLRGGDGNDVLFGGAEFDDTHGNIGDDTVHGGGFDDWVVGGQGNDALFGDEGGDLCYGNLGADTLDGGAGDDGVVGGQANDLLNGGAGNDFITGDRGDDTLTGGLGGDTFRTFGETGVDRITDFNAGEGDHLKVDAGVAYSVSQVGADVVVDMGGGNQAVLVGVTLSSLPTGWII